MLTSSWRYCLLLAAVALALAAHAQTWNYKGSWGTAEFTPAEGGTYACTYKMGDDQTFHVTYSVYRVLGDKIFIRGARGQDCIAHGWITAAHHRFIYSGREGGFVDLDGVNNAPLDHTPTFATDRSTWVATSVVGSAQAVVNDSAPKWSTRKPMQNGDWVLVDMGKDYTFKKVTMDSTGLGGDAAHGLQLLISKDGKEFTKVGELSADDCIKAAGMFVFTLPPDTTARYMKFIQTGTAGNWWAALDVSILETTPPSPPVVPVELTWTVTASAGISPDNVLTGEDERWTTSRPMQNGDFLQIDMLKGYKLKSVTLDSSRSPNDAAHGVQLMLSQDGTTFNKVAEKTAEECAALDGVVKFTLPAGAAARVIKFVQTGSNGPAWWSVNKVTIERDEPKQP